MRIKAYGDHILAVDGDFGDQVTASGIIIKDNSNKSQGITARWFKVFSVGPENKYPEIVEGEWVLVEYGRWTEGFTLEDERLPGGKGKCWKIDPKGVMAASNEKPKDVLYYNSDVVMTEHKTRY